MAKLIAEKIVLILVALALALWNYFLRDSMNIPLLSNLSSSTVYIIAGGLIVLDILIIIIHRKIENNS